MAELSLNRKTSNRTYFLKFVTNDLLSYTLLDFPTVKFNFSDEFGNIATRLVTDQVYFFTIVDECSKFHIVKTRETSSPVNPTFTKVKRTRDTTNEGLIFLYFPKGFTITNKTNISNFIFTFGDTFERSQQFYTRATDFYFLSGQKKIAVDCQPSCEGKLCNEENDCGLPCGCGSKNFICLPDGMCKDTNLQLREQKCSNDGTEICGSNKGLCFGKCQDGNVCTRDSSGRYSCVPLKSELNNYKNLVWIALILFALLIAVFVFWYKFRRTFEKSYITPESVISEKRIVTKSVVRSTTVPTKTKTKIIPSEDSRSSSLTRTVQTTTVPITSRTVPVTTTTRTRTTPVTTTTRTRTVPVTTTTRTRTISGTQSESTPITTTTQTTTVPSVRKTSTILSQSPSEKESISFLTRSNNPSASIKQSRSVLV